MKKFIAAGVAAVALVIAAVIFYLPQNLGESLQLNEHETLFITIRITGFRDGQIQHDFENFTVERGSAEFEAIEQLLADFSYRRVLRNRERLPVAGNAHSVIIFGGGYALLDIIAPSRDVYVNNILRSVSAGAARDFAERLTELLWE